MAPYRAPRDLISRQLQRSRAEANAPGFVRKTYLLDRDAARDTARQWFRNYPKAAYWTQVESWRVVDEDMIEFTMRRLPSAD